MNTAAVPGTALAYLSPEVRRRPNLAILTNTLFEGLTIADGRVDGGRLMRNNECMSIAACEVIEKCWALSQLSIHHTQIRRKFTAGWNACSAPFSSACRRAANQAKSTWQLM